MNHKIIATNLVIPPELISRMPFRYKSSDPRLMSKTPFLTKNYTKIWLTSFKTERNILIHKQTNIYFYAVNKPMSYSLGGWALRRQWINSNHFHIDGYGHSHFHQIAPEIQNQGVATELMKQTLSFAKKEKLYLTINDVSNPLWARSLIKLGFQITPSSTSPFRYVNYYHYPFDKQLHSRLIMLRRYLDEVINKEIAIEAFSIMAKLDSGIENLNLYYPN